MVASPLHGVVYPVLALLYMVVGTVARTSICQTMQYRALSMELQNEHQCIILERLQEDFEKDRDQLKNQYSNLNRMLLKLQSMMNRNIKSKISLSRPNSQAIPNLRDIPLVRDCHELHLNGISVSGVYTLKLTNQNTVNVWCDMDTDDGGWTMIQRRFDGSVNFTRNWEDYAFGFGNPNTEYWFGNENLHHLTHFKNFSIRFDLWDWDGIRAYALYNYFKVDDEATMYRLSIEGYSGTAGDAMSTHNNMRFSTIDNDNDRWFANCAHKDLSGWWYDACGNASLNGLYTNDSTADISPDGLVKGIVWYSWKNNSRYSMKRTEIKIKPFNAIKLEREKLEEANTVEDVKEELNKDVIASETDSGGTEGSSGDAEGDDYEVTDFDYSEFTDK